MKAPGTIALIAFACAASSWCYGGEAVMNPVPPAGPPPGVTVLEGEVVWKEGKAGGDGGGGGGASADQGTVKVYLDSDVIYLRDGNEVHGTIILVAQKGAVVLTEQGEELVPRENIEKMVRARDKERPVTLPIRLEDGFKFIVMEPIEESDAPGDAPEAKAAPKKPAAPKAAAVNKDRPKGEALKEMPLGDDELKKLKEAGGKISELLKQAEHDPELKKKIEELKKGPLPTKKW